LLEFSVLASGSSGNSTYIRTETTQILLDTGISKKQLELRLQDTCQANLADLSAVLITHEHIDHVRGLKQVLKHSSADLYMTEGTWSQVSSQVADKNQDSDEQNGDSIKFVKDEASFVIGDIRVTPFRISHDAEEPVAFRFDTEHESLAVVTDLGYVSDTIKSLLTGCRTFVFEANHDVEMLRAGRYPWSVKRRILGDKGHLSNTDSAIAMIDLLGTQEVDVYLAHLSEENNQPDLADLTVKSVLCEAKALYGEQVSLHRTSRHMATPLHRIHP
jgi:phosphoribosyl 1,2-cyclic phosphodiesterase